MPHSSSALCAPTPCVVGVRCMCSALPFTCSPLRATVHSDRPGNMADVYHTFFGICGLSLLGCGTGEDGEGAVLTSAGEKLVLKAVDPAFAMPVDVVKRLGLSSQRL